MLDELAKFPSSARPAELPPALFRAAWRHFGSLIGARCALAARPAEYALARIADDLLALPIEHKLESVERALILAAVTKADGNRSKAVRDRDGTDAPVVAEPDPLQVNAAAEPLCRVRDGVHSHRHHHDPVTHDHEHAPDVHHGHRH